MDNQHMVMWWCLISTQGQAQKLISGSSLIAETRLLTFNRTQSRAVTGLLNGHNTLRRHLYIMGLMDSPLCRRRGAEEVTSAYVLCECEALASLRHIYFGSFFLDPEDVRSQGLRAIEDLSRGTGFP